MQWRPNAAAPSEESVLNGYKAGYIEEYSDTVPEGTVISQSVQEGKVVIVVSKGPKP